MFFTKHRCRQFWSVRYILNASITYFLDDHTLSHINIHISSFKTGKATNHLTRRAYNSYSRHLGNYFKIQLRYLVKKNVYRLIA